MKNIEIKNTIETLKDYGMIDTNNLNNDDIILLKMFTKYIEINNDLKLDYNSDKNISSHYLDQLTEMIEDSNSDLKYLVYKYWNWI